MNNRHKFSPDEFEQYAANKRRARMEMIDNYPPELRNLVHEYGFNIVKTFLDNGVKRPAIIRHLVEVVLNDFSPTRASYSLQGVSKDSNRAAMKPALGIAALNIHNPGGEK